MTYFNPVLAYGVDRFARDLRSAGGLGVITPDLIVDEAGPWLSAARSTPSTAIFLVAPSSPSERIRSPPTPAVGFVYAASTMGVTGARDECPRPHRIWSPGAGRSPTSRSGSVSASAPRRRSREIAAYADAVIVGSALVGAVADSQDQAAAVEAMRRYAADRARAPGVAELSTLRTDGQQPESCPSSVRMAG